MTTHRDTHAHHHQHTSYKY